MSNVRRSRLARLMAATTVGVMAFAVFAMLGGIDLAHSSIRQDQYGGPVRHISIVKASATRRGTVSLRVVIIGWKMYPRLVGSPFNKNDGGHWATFADRHCNNISTNRTSGATRPLKKGAHKLFAELANNDGSYLTPEVRSNTVRVRITRTVAKPRAAAPRSCRPLLAAFAQ